MKNTIKINPEKFKALLETTTGKSLKEIATENGYSAQLFKNVLRRGEASPNIQAVVRLYGIEPSAYEDKPIVEATEPVTSDETDAKQITFDEVLSQLTLFELKGAIAETVRALIYDDVKAVVKDVIAETLNNVEVRAEFNPHRQSYDIYTRSKDNSDKWAI